MFVVDDDASVRTSLIRLLRASGLHAKGFDRPSALLAEKLPDRGVCLVVDVNLPEMNGVELCQRLQQSGRRIPTIIITGQSDLGTQRVMEHAPAVAVFMKPVPAQPLLDAIARAMRS